MNIINPRPSSSFVAIDVEYADREQNICQVGLAVVRNLEVTENRSWLIQPPDNHYEAMQMSVHYISPQMTENSPSLEDVWPEIQPYLLMGELWAHNATSVEQPVLVKNLRRCGLAYEYLTIRDSRELYERPDCGPGRGDGLKQCCMALGIGCENHHDAGHDALCCAEIVISYLKGREPDWDGVPMSNEQLRKSQQDKVVLRMGGFAAHQKLQDERKKAGAAVDKTDLFAELASSYDGAPLQTVDVFDKGDLMQKDGQDLVDYSRFNMGDGCALRGKTVAMTGFFHIPRKEIERALNAVGAATDGMTARTDILLVGSKNVGLPKLAKYEKQTAKGRQVALVVGDADLDVLLYGDGWRFFR